MFYNNSSECKIDLDYYKPTLPNTDKALCHNDLSGSNLLLNPESDDILAGIIDFGNVVVMPKYQDFFPLYKVDRKLAIDTLTEYTLEKRKDRPSFKPEVAKVLENFAGSYQREILNQKQIQITKNKIY